jgi:hypothetical protein
MSEHPVARRTVIAGAGLTLGAGLMPAVAGATERPSAATIPPDVSPIPEKMRTIKPDDVRAAVTQARMESSEFWASKGGVKLYLYRKRAAPKAGDAPQPCCSWCTARRIPRARATT